MAKPDKNKSKNAAPVKVAAKPEKKAEAPKKAAEEKPEKKEPERPKYGVVQLAEALGTKPASVRVRLRNHGVPKNGKTYGWNTQKELEAVIKQLKSKKSDDDAEESDDDEDTDDEDDTDEDGDDEESDDEDEDDE